jgi:GNAT superfamily N-acetyltransferase
MKIDVQPTTLERIKAARDIYRHEMNCQIIHDSIHARPGWTQEYSLHVQDVAVGYGSIAVAGPWKDAPALYEFFVLPDHRTSVFDLFDALVEASGAKLVETQSNDRLLTVMLHSRGSNITCELILFQDEVTTHLSPAGVLFRATRSVDDLALSESGLDRGAQWAAIVGEKIAGVGCLLSHYNRPYHDIWMQVAEPCRNRGIGSFIVQELKRVCYGCGSVPAARCNISNHASRKSLQKAGFVPCGNLLKGVVLV